MINFSTSQVFAQVDLKAKYNPPFSDIGSFVTVIINNAIFLVGFLMFLLIVFGAFSFITGAGGKDPEKMEKGQKIITWTLVGFAVVISVYFLIDLIKMFTGFDIFNPK